MMVHAVSSRQHAMIARCRPAPSVIANHLRTSWLGKSRLLWLHSTGMDEGVASFQRLRASGLSEDAAGEIIKTSNIAVELGVSTPIAQLSKQLEKLETQQSQQLEKLEMKLKDELKDQLKDQKSKIIDRLNVSIFFIVLALLLVVPDSTEKIQRFFSNLVSLLPILPK